MDKIQLRNILTKVKAGILSKDQAMDLVWGATFDGETEKVKEQYEVEEQFAINEDGSYTGPTG